MLSSKTDHPPTSRGILRVLRRFKKRRIENTARQMPRLRGTDTRGRAHKKNLEMRDETLWLRPLSFAG